jgi:adenosylcobyric acid synthase
LFDEPEACAALLGWAGLVKPQPMDYGALREASINRLADAMEQDLQTDRLIDLIG